MRKIIKLVIPMSIVVFILSNFSTDTNKKFIFTSMGDIPVLPTKAYAYSDVEMPEHLFNAPEDDVPSGYEPVDVSPDAFENINDDVATLGRVLFYDEKLSALENISCGSCHLQEKSFADDGKFSEGIDAPTLRNSMHLNDIAWTSNERFFWHMKESTLRETILLPLTDDNEIGANMDDIVVKLNETSYYPELFEKAFGGSYISEERIITALEQFLNSMHTFNSKFDKEAENDFAGLTSSELRGLELFSENCGSCHTQGAHDVSEFTGGSGNIFINIETPTLQILPNIFNNGLPKDQEDEGAGSWNEDYDQLFKIPTLRNIELTGPYMHDGRFETLEEVVDHYSSDAKENIWSIGLIPDGGFNFSDTDKKDLVAFMKILTDKEFTEDPKWSDPFELTSYSEEELIDILIKPNPMSSYAVIEFENKGSKPALINILNSNGQLIKSDKVQNTVYEINKSDYLSGIYFVEITIDDKKQTQKLIVK